MYFVKIKLFNQTFDNSINSSCKSFDADKEMLLSTINGSGINDVFTFGSMHMSVKFMVIMFEKIDVKHNSPRTSTKKR